MELEPTRAVAELAVDERSPHAPSLDKVDSVEPAFSIAGNRTLSPTALSAEEKESLSPKSKIVHTVTLTMPVLPEDEKTSPRVVLRMPSEAARTSPIVQGISKFWLRRFACRCGYEQIRTFSVAELCFWLWCAGVFGLCVFLVLRHLCGGSNRLWVLHSGLLTGVFYAMTILLSLRFPFYWKWCVRMGFDRQMVYHRKCAWLGAACCVLHIVDNLDTLLSWKAITGWLCFGFAVLILVAAHSHFRRKHYNSLFVPSHILFVTAFLVAGWLHNAVLVVYGTFVIAIDVAIRFFDNSCRSTAVTNITSLDNGRVIKIEFIKSHFSYRAGQYVFVRIPWLGLLEFHPFSLSSYPSSGSTCSLHIKRSVAGDDGWTAKLCELVKRHEHDTHFLRSLSMQVEGPFGELTLKKELYHYEHVVFVGGGIGVTPLDSLFNQLVTDLLEKTVPKGAKTRRIEFIFTTRSLALIREFALRNKAWQVKDQHRDQQSRPSMEQVAHGGRSVTMTAMAESPGSLRLKSIDRTAGLGKVADLQFEVPTPNQREKYNANGLEITNTTHITRVKDASLRRQYTQTYPFIRFERPNIREIINAAASYTKSRNICVLTSGPRPMINDCRRWGAELGIDVHYEVFDW